MKPFVKHAKNDRNDAEAICEAAGRPGMRFVPVKTTTQQAQGMSLKARETLVHQRTQLVNALRLPHKTRKYPFLSLTFWPASAMTIQDANFSVHTANPQ